MTMQTGKQWQNKRRVQQVRGFYGYTVACVGLLKTVEVYVRLRGRDLADTAKAIARQQKPGAVAYSVIMCEEE